MNTIRAAAAAALVTGVLVAVPARADATLLLSNWLPPNHPVTVDIVKPWTELVAKESGGKVRIDILPKPVGQPPQHFDLARDGVADVVLAVQGYTPGRFVSDKIASLPFLGDSAEATSVAAWRTHDKFFRGLGEYEGTQLLAIWTHGPGQLHTTKKEIRDLDDFKGLKIRTTGGYVKDVMDALGVVSVLKPATENYELLSSGVVDGTALPVESILAFKLEKLTPHTTIVPGGLYTATFFLAMNKKKYDSLAPEDRAAIDRASYERLARFAGAAFDQRDATATEQLKKMGNKVSTVDAALLGRIRQAVGPIDQKWVEEVKAKGVDGQAALAYFMAQVKEVQKK